MTLTWGPKSRSISAFDVLGLVGLVGLFTARFIPVAKLIPFWGCGFRKVTGYPCPGCGLTRAADHFAHLDFFGAFKANPLGTFGAAVFAVLAVWTVLHLAFKVPTPSVWLEDRQWKLLRNVAIVLFALNYAFVIAEHRLHLL